MLNGISSSIGAALALAATGSGVLPEFGGHKLTPGKPKNTRKDHNSGKGCIDYTYRGKKEWHAPITAELRAEIAEHNARVEAGVKHKLFTKMRRQANTDTGRFASQPNPQPSAEDLQTPMATSIDYETAELRALANHTVANRAT